MSKYSFNADVEVKGNLISINNEDSLIHFSVSDSDGNLSYQSGSTNIGGQGTCNITQAGGISMNTSSSIELSAEGATLNGAQIATLDDITNGTMSYQQITEDTSDNSLTFSANKYILPTPWQNYDTGINHKVEVDHLNLLYKNTSYSFSCGSGPLITNSISGEVFDTPNGMCAVTMYVQAGPEGEKYITSILLAPGQDDAHSRPFVSTTFNMYVTEENREVPCRIVIRNDFLSGCNLQKYVNSEWIEITDDISNSFPYGEAYYIG